MSSSYSLSPFSHNTCSIHLTFLQYINFYWFIAVHKLFFLHLEAHCWTQYSRFWLRNTDRRKRISFLHPLSTFLLIKSIMWQVFFSVKADSWLMASSLFSLTTSKAAFELVYSNVRCWMRSFNPICKQEMKLQTDLKSKMCVTPKLDWFHPWLQHLLGPFLIFPQAIGTGFIAH